MLACPVVTETEENAALQRSVPQLLEAGDAASVERGGPIQCLVGQTSLQLIGKDCSPADAAQFSGLAMSSSEQGVSRHLGEGPSCSTAACHVTEQQASRPQAAAAQEPVSSKAGTAGTSCEAIAQCIPEDDSACRQAEQGASQGAGHRRTRQSRDSLSTVQACKAFMADVSSLQLGDSARQRVVECDSALRGIMQPPGSPSGSIDLLMPTPMPNRTQSLRGCSSYESWHAERLSSV